MSQVMRWRQSEPFAQVSAPWPSRTVDPRVPVRVRWRRDLKLIQTSAVRVVGASKVPKMMTLGERSWKQGPVNETPARKKVPSGINKVDLSLYAHASSHAAMNAYNNNNKLSATAP